MKEVTIEEVRDFCKVLDFLSARQRKHFLQTMNKTQMRGFEVACFNLATNHRGLSTKQIASLKRYKRQVETVASKQFKFSEKRKLISQRGGFISAVLPILSTLVSSFLTK